MCTLFWNISVQLDDITWRKQWSRLKYNDGLTLFAVTGGDLCDFVIWEKQYNPRADEN